MGLRHASADDRIANAALESIGRTLTTAMAGIKALADQHPRAAAYTPGEIL